MSTVPPGTPCWADLATPDLADARRFYPQMFGWTGRITPEPGAGGYTVFLLDGGAVAGAGPPAIPDQVPIPEDSPAYWSVHFSMVDADAAAARAGEPGTILVPPRDIPAGHYAGLRDPQGALFSVIALARTGAG